MHPGLVGVAEDEESVGAVDGRSNPAVSTSSRRRGRVPLAISRDAEGVMRDAVEQTQRVKSPLSVRITRSA
jgi:hypothetical protein